RRATRWRWWPARRCWAGSAPARSPGTSCARPGPRRPEPMSQAPADIRHLDGSEPRIMVVDGSRLVRKLIGDVLRAELPAATVVPCAGVAERSEERRVGKEVTGRRA